MTTLTITLGEDGVRVEGPINDKMTCYALLEMARDAVRDFNQNPEKKPLIELANPAIRLT